MRCCLEDRILDAVLGLGHDWNLDMQKSTTESREPSETLTGDLQKRTDNQICADTKLFRDMS